LEKDLGQTFGYNLPLSKAETKYFMRLGPHDLLDKNYTSPMIHMLENSDAVGSYPASRTIEIDGGQVGVYDCWYATRLTSDSASERVYALIAHLHEVSAFYGIYKTEIIKKYPLPEIIGNDHILLCQMASCGKLIFSPRSIFNWRQTKPPLNHEDSLKIWHKAIANGNNKSIDTSLKAMCQAQLQVLKQCKSRDLIDYVKKLWLVRKAKKKLKKRFGY
jgi:hypothetical protein